jgi:hypothetical protein
MKVKIAVHVPLNAEETMRDALGDAGAGVIGEYSYCSFTTKGIGRFRPSEKAKPYIGNAGQIEVVEEARIEVVCAREDARRVVRALKVAHPYEEPAFEIVPLIDESEL